MKPTLTLLAALLLAPLAGLSAAELRFAGLFTDHAVLQRDAATPVWGSADPDEKVTVVFGGQRKSATADATGKWLVRLDPMPASAEVFNSLSVASNRAAVSFTHAGEGLMAQGGSLKGFTMAGVDGKFIAARAVIHGSTVVVTSDKIDKPVAVRYGWATVPDGNLFNREGLPAAPFRCDMPTKLNSAVKQRPKPDTL